MSLPNVTINIERSGLGGVALTNDMIAGMVLTGVEVTGILELGTGYVIYSTDDLVDLGITSADDDENAFAYKHIKEFFDEAPSGAKLYLYFVPDSYTLSDLVNKALPECPAKKLQEYAQGEIRIMTVAWNAPEEVEPTLLDGLDQEVFSAALNANDLAEDMISEITPCVFIIPGMGYTGIAAELRDLTGMSNARSAIVLGCTADDKVAAVGLVLGRLAAIPVQRKISRVKDGAVNTLYGYLTDGTSIKDAAGDLGGMHDKGYIVLRQFPTKSGYYFNGDHTCTPVSDDLHTISNNRVINKAVVITYNTYVEEVDEEIEVTDKGTLDPAMIAYLQAKIENAINLNMNGEISNFEAYIDPAQNILSVPRLNIVLRITPVGYLSQINVYLGFKNPALTS